MEEDGKAGSCQAFSGRSEKLSPAALRDRAAIRLVNSKPVLYTDTMRPALWITACLTLALQDHLHADFRVGTAKTDVTPATLPVIVNGGMTSRTVDRIKTPLSARSLAFSDGKETLVIVVVDSCMMPRDLLDQAKELASEKSGIPREHMLISATHTHTAGSCMGALGTSADPVYSLFLTKKLVEAILAPLDRMVPAEIGWGEIDAGDYTALRRWVIHPSRVKDDPFGNPTVRANMHAATKRDDVTGPSGPEDPMLSVLSVRTAEGKPLAMLANFSMHYFGDKDISADYFGLFCEGLKEEIAPEDDRFLAIMSHGCSGDIWRFDYEKSSDRASDTSTIEGYSADLRRLAREAIADITYETPSSLAMAETRLPLKYRVPDQQRLEWGQRITRERGDKLPSTQPEVYAAEQVILAELKETEVVVQGLRLGDHISIATTPCETYALTGLKIKAASPTKHTMVIELANGGDGYIPPPEQHLLGGYNTWAARSAGLEVEAEPKITEAAIQMIEQVTRKPRTDRRPGHGSTALHMLSLKPRAYWRLDEFAGARAYDASPNGLDATYEPQILFYLPGPQDAAFSAGGLNRSAHFAGDRLSARIPGLTGSDYSVSLWFWSGTAPGLMTETEWFFSRGRDYDTTGFSTNESRKAPPLGGDHIGLKNTATGVRLIRLSNQNFGESPASPALQRWTWYHLVFVREGNTARMYLDGQLVRTETGDQVERNPDTFFFGGSCAGHGFFQGRLDEVAVFDRALSEEEVAGLAAQAK
jgi:Concanavalin A-like lectin/glucanases superfamily